VIFAEVFACVTVRPCRLYFQKGRAPEALDAANLREVRPVPTVKGRRRRRQRLVVSWLVLAVGLAGAVLFSTSWAKARPGVLDAILLVTLTGIAILVAVTLRARTNEMRVTTPSRPLGAALPGFFG
jgi:hypothetical protein